MAVNVGVEVVSSLKLYTEPLKNSNSNTRTRSNRLKLYQFLIANPEQMQHFQFSLTKITYFTMEPQLIPQVLI